MNRYAINRARQKDRVVSRVMLGFLMAPLALMFTIAGAMMAAA
jgi:hypothetical protein